MVRYMYRQGRTPPDDTGVTSMARATFAGTHDVPAYLPNGSRTFAVVEGEHGRYVVGTVPGRPYANDYATWYVDGDDYAGTVSGHYFHGDDHGDGTLAVAMRDAYARAGGSTRTLQPGRNRI